jgi:hypothetical protein
MWKEAAVDLSDTIKATSFEGKRKNDENLQSEYPVSNKHLSSGRLKYEVRMPSPRKQRAKTNNGEP